MNKKILGYRLVVLLALIPLGSSQAQNRYEEQILAQLEATSAVFISAGYTPIMGDGGTLDHQYYEDYSVNLISGVEYGIVGVCDEDCSDLDLALFDGYGDLVTQDESADDIPVVEFTVIQSGEFTLRVTMYRCDNNPCYYGVGLYGR